MPILNLASFAEFDRAPTQFVIGQNNFADLEIQPTNDGSGFHYFYHRVRGALVKEFVLDRTPQTLTYCTVTLIGTEDGFEPRLFLKKDGLTKSGWKKGTERIENVQANVLVKAAVDLGNAHYNFWSLVSFLSSVKEVSLPSEPLLVVNEEAADLVALLEKGGKDKVIEVVRVAVGGQLTESDVRLLIDRRAALSEFERLLREPEYLQQRIEDTGARGEEPMWQAFFEEHPWIFGYGLKLVACEGLDDERLEQMTSGSTAFDATGDRVDALMASKGLIQSLLFVEIKKASTKLLHASSYRSGVYHPSTDFSGAVSQVQTAAHRAVTRLDEFKRPIGRDGWPKDVVGTIRPRQVVVIGTLDEFRRNSDVNVDFYRSFELYRRSIVDVEIITFDELFARASFIARNQEISEGTNESEEVPAQSEQTWADSMPAPPSPQPADGGVVPF